MNFETRIKMSRMSILALLMATCLPAQEPGYTTAAVTDPAALQLAFASFLGGSGEGRIHGVATDRDGNLWVTAPVGSTDFPTTSDALQKEFTGVILAKLGRGSELLYSTFVGVPGGINYAHGVAIDSQGCIYVTGNTTNPRFPTTPGAFQTDFKGPADGHHGDVFVVKFSPDGRRIIYSTLLGGTGRDIAGRIAVDGDGHAYILGSTSSADLPVTPGAFQTTFAGGEETPTGRGDIFVAKLSPDGSRLVYCTYVGGTGLDVYGNAIAVDDAGRICFSGTTQSTDFPTTAHACQASYGGSLGGRGAGDAVVVRLDPTGSTLDYASYLGGSGDESGTCFALGAEGSLWVAGETSSSDFPVPAGSTPVRPAGPSDLFLARIDLESGALLHSSLIGGTGTDRVSALVELSSVGLILAGQTDSVDFPALDNVGTTAIQGPTDLFLSVVNSATGRPQSSMLLGGSGYEVPGPVCLRDNAELIFAGNTTSADFPVTAGADDTTYRGGTSPWGGDGFVARFVVSSTGTFEIAPSK